MKKLLLFTSLLIGGGVLAQTSPLDFEPGGNGASFGWATFESPEGFENPTLTIEANPATDGINSSATAARIDISYPATDFWGQAGTETDNPGVEMGSWEFNDQNSTVKVMVYQEGFAAPVAIKFANNSFGAEFQTVVENIIADEWVEITFDMSSLIGSGLAPFTQFIFYPSHAERATGHVVWFDNVTFGPAAPPAGDPMVSPADPTIDEADVLSVYSETYMTNTVMNFNLNAFSNDAFVFSEVDIESSGNLSAKMENLLFYGAEWTAENLNEFDFVHLDYYATSSTGFNFYLIDQTAGIPGGDIAEPRFAFGPAGDAPLVQGEWVSVFIPLQHFLDYDAGMFTYDLDDIFQYKFDGNGGLWFDNIYFTTEEALSVTDIEEAGLNAFPNPSVDSWTITSEFTPITEVRVFNVLGQVVFSASPNSSLAQIDASGLDTGLYMTEVTTNRGKTTIKLIKE
ncbi:MAG: T9SS type A sorting domain-containing protein [Bacteroidota bacterium]